MILSIENVLTPEEFDFITTSLNTADFIDGKTTAGWHAKFVKNNTQLSSKASYGKDLRDLVRTALKRNSLFEMAVRPKAIHSILFSRYEVGMSYGSHTDNAIMGSQPMMRSDISLTLFLSDPDTYQGGELVIEGIEGDRPFKLAANSAILYPSSSLHRVEPVTEGVRLVAVGWVQSLIREASEREILFDLDMARRAIFAQIGKTTEFDLISKSHANLMRKWADL
jgi:PKHD-type hydroxylase